MDDDDVAQVKLGVWTASKQQVFGVLKYSEMPSRGQMSTWDNTPLYYNDVGTADVDKLTLIDDSQTKKQTMAEQLARNFQVGMQGQGNKLYRATPTVVQGRYIALFKNDNDGSYTAHPIHGWHTVDTIRNVRVNAADVQSKMDEDADITGPMRRRRIGGGDDDAEDDDDDGEFDFEEAMSDDDDGSSLDSVGRTMLATMAPAIDDEDALPDIFQSKSMHEMYQAHAADKEEEIKKEPVAVKRERAPVKEEEFDGATSAPPDKKSKVKRESIREISEKEIIRLVKKADEGMSAARLINKFQASFRNNPEKKKAFARIVKKVLSKSKNSKGQNVLKVKLGFR